MIRSLCLLACLGACASPNYLATAPVTELVGKPAIWVTYSVDHSECMIRLKQHRGGAEFALRLPQDRHSVSAPIPVGSFDFESLECNAMRQSPGTFDVNIREDGVYYLGHIGVTCENDGIKNRCHFRFRDGKNRPSNFGGELAEMRAKGRKVFSPYGGKEITEDMLSDQNLGLWSRQVSEDTGRRKTEASRKNFSPKERKSDLPEDLAKLSSLKAFAGDCFTDRVDGCLRHEQQKNPSSFGSLEAVGHYANGALDRTELVGSAKNSFSPRFVGCVERVLSACATPKHKQARIKVQAN